MKIFLHITPEEQVRRFKDRLTNPLKRWKLSYEDFRNRAKWDEYVEAIEQMMAETSRPTAPWYVVPANDKKYARIAALKILVDQLGRGVALEPRPVDPAIAKEASRLFDVRALRIGIGVSIRLTTKQFWAKESQPCRRAQNPDRTGPS